MSAQTFGLRPLSGPSFRFTPRPFLSASPFGRREDAFRDLGTQLLGLRSSLASLLDATRTTQRRGLGILRPGAGALSRFSIALEGATRASLLSTEEVSPRSTSFLPTQPIIQGSSTSQVTIGGVYDGSLGDDTLTFEVKKPGTVGQDVVQIEVFDSQGNKLEQFKLDRNAAPGTPVELTNGLTVAFTAGTLERGDTFTVDVFADGGARLDPTQAFREVTGLYISEGSFTINGATIDVSEDDSLQDVLDRITQSGAGVTASYDETTDKVTLTQNRFGSAYSIELGPDDSGFLAAFQLDTAQVTPGTDDDFGAPLAQVGAFASVTQGSFLVNGNRIDVDPLTDSLSDVLARIEFEVPGVRARFDPYSKRVSLTPPAGSELKLDDDDSGLLRAIGIAEGTFGGRSRRAGPLVDRVSDEPTLRLELRELARIFTRLDGASSLGTADHLVDQTLRALHDAAREALVDMGEDPSERGILRTGLGLTFSVPDGSPFELDESLLKTSAKKHTEELLAFLRGDEDDEDGGFLRKLDGAIEDLQHHLVRYLDPGKDTGLILDLKG